MVTDKTIRRMHIFNNHVKVEDCAQIGQNQEKTQYSKPGKNIKRKASGKQPLEYNAVELLVDFRAALSRGSYEEAAHCYFQLRRLLNWG